MAYGTPTPQMPIAVVGIGALLPDARSLAECWRNIVTARDLMTDVPASRWLIDDYYDPDPAAADRTYARRGAFLPEIEFDPMRYGIPPNALSAIDTSQLLALLVTEQVLADCAGGPPADRERVSVLLGASSLQLVVEVSGRLQRPIWLKALREAGIAEPEAQAICDKIAANYVPWQEETFPGLLTNVIAGRIANRFDLHGINHTTDAACASSFAALYTAIAELTLGRSDLVITGGVDTMNDITMYTCFSRTPALSPTGDCRPFSDAADGTMLGEGIVMFALKRLADAERDGDQVYAVIRGIGASSDGQGGAIYAPLPEGQVLALRRAYEVAGYGPETVELLEAHGTGTKAGDAAEFAALREVFGASGGVNRQWCALGSVKSQVGHTKSAAGAVGLLKAVLALQHKILPPTIKADQPNPALGLDDSPFYLNTRARPWTHAHAAGHPRRASVSSFGFGGTNFHVTVEEYRPSGGSRARPARRLPVAPELVLLSAGSSAELLRRVSELDASHSLPDVVRDSRLGFRTDDNLRLAVVADSMPDLTAKLSAAAARIERGEPFSATGVHLGIGAALEGRVGFLFPGQGSQYTGMGADVAMHLPAAQATWDRVAEIGVDRVVFPPPACTDAARREQEATLTATEWAQPALAAHSAALLAVLTDLALTPDCVAGHSFGELSALHAAGAFDVGTLVMLARKRGELMRGLGGAMLAVSASRQQTQSVTAGLEDIWLANHNAPSQVVLAGTRDALETAAGLLTGAGITTTWLNAAAAFHSPLVASAAGPLLEFLRGADLRGPALAVYGGADACPYPDDPDEVRHRLAEQLTAPVRFGDVIEAMYRDGVRTFVEVGPGAVLTGLTGQVLGDREHAAIPLDRKGRGGVAALLDGLGRLAVRGIALDFAALGEPASSLGEAPAADGKRLTVKIDGGNYGRPYPPRPDAVPPKPAAMPPAPAIGPTPDEGWLAVVEAAQQQMAEAHEAFQQAMTESHQTYLRMAETTLTGLLGIAAGQPLAMPAQPLAAPAQPVLTPRPPAPPPAPVPPPEPAAHQALDAEGIESLLLSVVADRTGYPVEMLNADMDLETDIGIDSIKKVEILSAIREQAGDMPGVDLATFASLRTVRAIAEKTAEMVGPAVPDPQMPDPHVPDPQMPDPRPESPLSRYVMRTIAAPPGGLAMLGLADGPVAVTDDGTGVAPLLARRLVARDISAEVVTSVPASARSVVLLDGLRAAESAEDAIAVNQAAFRAARQAAPQLEAGGVFVTVQDTGGDFGLTSGANADPKRAWLGGLSALARTAALEWPRAAVKAIDCARAGRTPDEVAAAIADELIAGGPAIAVGLRGDGGRVAVTWASAPVRPRRPAISEDSVIVATGGARGVTAIALRALASRYRPRLALLGRRPLTAEPEYLRDARDEASLIRLLAGRSGLDGPARTPAEIAAAARDVLAGREIRQTLAAIERSGTSVRYLPVDVRDGAALAAALAEVRGSWGPITGVVHGAGVLADSLIAGKTDEQFASVFAVKVDGLRALLAATAADPLDLLCAFSSVAAYAGNPGQSDYAMANEVLNQVLAAEQARRPGCLVRAIAWGPWQGGMITETLAERFRGRGVALIDPRAGAEAFLAELGDGGDVRVILSADDDPGMAARAGDGIAAQVTVAAPGYGYLADHQVGGVPVVPVATVLDWFAGAARSWRPGEGPIVLRDLRVLNKIALPRLADGGHRLVLRGHESTGPDGLELDLDLRGDADLPHYRASVVSSTPPQARAWDIPGDLEPPPRLYDGVTLFHGRMFQAIRGVRGVSPEGAEGTVIGSCALGWPGSSWRVDPAAVDGGLQLAVLWAQRAGAGRTLPMAVRECRVYREGGIADAVRCVVLARQAGDSVAECDVALIDADGAPRVELAGVRLVRRPE